MVATTLPAVVRVVDLPVGTTVTGAELIEAVQTTAGVGVSVQISLNQIFTSIGGVPTGGATGTILNKSSGSNYSTQFSAINTFVNVGTSLATTGSATSIVAFVANQGITSTQIANNAVGTNQIASSLGIASSLNIGTLLTVSGTATFNGTAIFNGTTIYNATTVFNNGIQVTGTSQFTGAFNVAGTSIVTGTLGVIGTSQFTGLHNISGTTNVTGIFNVVGTTFITGTFGQVGTSLMTGLFGVFGTAVFTGIHNVVGTTLFTSGTFGIVGTTLITGTFGQVGTSLMTGAFGVVGTSTYTGLFTVLGTSAFTGGFNFSVLGTSTFTGAHFVNGTTLFTSGTFGVVGTTLFTSGTFGVVGTTLFTSGAFGVVGTTLVTGVFGVNGTSTFTGTFVLGNQGAGTLVSSATGVVTATTAAGSVLLETLSPAGVTSIDTSASWAGFNTIEFQFSNIVPGTVGAFLQMRVNAGGVVQSTTYLNSGFSSTNGAALSFQTNTDALYLCGGNSLGTAVPGSNGSVRLYGVPSTTQPKAMNGVMLGLTNAATTVNMSIVGGWWNGGTAAVTGARVLLTAGVMTGTIRVYGLN